MEAGVWSSRGAQSVEASGRCQLMEDSMFARE